MGQNFKGLAVGPHKTTLHPLLSANTNEMFGLSSKGHIPIFVSAAL